MPIYEYRCGRCEKTFEATQSVHVRVEDTVCPFCQAQEATRLISSVASKVIGSHKTGFSEMKAYNMLSERASKFAKLPPVFGARTEPPPIQDIFSGSEPPPSGPPKKSET
ncbi:MAG TPA: zinc ribbon domain-containing protein [Nitrospira sp.]|nr:zinc ribbon domain-containing protein [Nitrospira sp.]